MPELERLGGELVFVSRLPVVFVSSKLSFVSPEDLKTMWPHVGRSLRFSP